MKHLLNKTYTTAVIGVIISMIFSGCEYYKLGVGKGQYLQIERLGRPAINEGLIVTNDYLNAFNAIPPSSDLDVGNPLILNVLTEAATFLGAFDSLDGVINFGAGFDSEVVKGFLPDVMRIDTAVSIPP